MGYEAYCDVLEAIKEKEPEPMVVMPLSEFMELQDAAEEIRYLKRKLDETQCALDLMLERADLIDENTRFVK